MTARPQEAVLLLITLAWGASFLVIRVGVGEGGPYRFLLLRFGAAVAVLGLLSIRDWRRFARVEVGRGVALGVILFLGYSLQTVGLQTVSGGKSAFITSLYVPLVPLLQWGWTGRAPRPAAWAGVGLAFAGLALLSTQEVLSFRFDRGEILTFGAALAGAVEILLLGAWSRGLDPRRWAACQMATVAALAGVATLLMPGPTVRHAPTLLLCALGLGAATSAIRVGMNWAQQAVPPTRATLIYALEPAWAGLIGRFAGETLTPLNLLGAALIVAGVLTSELWPSGGRPD